MRVKHCGSKARKRKILAVNAKLASRAHASYRGRVENCGAKRKLYNNFSEEEEQRWCSPTYNNVQQACLLALKPSHVMPLQAYFFTKAFMKKIFPMASIKEVLLMMSLNVFKVCIKPCFGE